MSRWMISHASAYIITSILASMFINIVLSIYNGSFKEFGFSVAILSFMYYLFFLFGTVIMLILFFIRKKESAWSNLILLMILSIIAGFVYQAGTIAIGLIIYYAVASIMYVLLQLFISNLLVNRLHIQDEFLNEKL